MKRTIAIILVMLTLSPFGRSFAEEQIGVIATTFAPYDFAREIAGDRADVRMLLPPAAESHSYEPTPQDIIAIAQCDVFIYVGGESDAWITDILSSMDVSNIKIVTLMDCVEAVPEELVEGMEGEAEAGALDEHVWTSPRNAALIAEKIAAALAEADFKNADVYAWNLDSYLEKLSDLNAAFQGVVNNAKRRTLVFGDRFPFRYFTDAYGLDYYAAFPGCSSESEPSAKTIAFLIDKVKSEDIPVVFHGELSSPKIGEVICEATGASTLQLHACHNIAKSDFEQGASYLSLMWENVDALKEALN